MKLEGPIAIVTGGSKAICQASERAWYVTGTTSMVDGGVTKAA